MWKSGRNGAGGVTFEFLMPGDQSVQMRAAMVARLAGRVAELASDLQVLAMLLQVPPDSDSSLAERPEVDVGASAVDDAIRQAFPTLADGRLGVDKSSSPVPEADDPFVRASLAIEALRGALRPDDLTSGRRVRGAID